MTAPITYSSSEALSKAFLHHLIPTFNVPSPVTTDGDAQFQSKSFIDFPPYLELNIRTTAYHPSFNGIVERSQKINDLFHFRLSCN